MKLIVGLGNPDKKYQNTRHNAGFLALDKIQSEVNLNEPFSNWTKSEKMKSFVSETKFNDEKIILLKPQTYMNLSGEAVNIAAVFYKLTPEDIWVIHDEIDLPLGTLRIKFDGSAAGHKGVSSIINHLGSKKFFRFRLGIRPADDSNINTVEFVLQKFESTEQEPLLKMLAQTCEAVQAALKETPEIAMNKYN